MKGDWVSRGALCTFPGDNGSKPEQVLLWEACFTPG